VLRPALACALLAITAHAGAADLLVSAASSLTNAFNELGSSYEAAHPGTKVLLNYGASGALLQQISKGAPADVLATADQETMDQAAAQKLIDPSGRRDFVKNTLVVVSPLDGRIALRQLSDLTRLGRVAIGAPASVPVGRYAKKALEEAGLWTAVSPKAITTQNVRQSLDYVARGEVDAAFVYATDAAQFKDKVHLAFTVPLATAVRYPVAPVQASAHAMEARRFIDYLRSPAGQAILGRYGFTQP